MFKGYSEDFEDSDYSDYSEYPEETRRNPDPESIVQVISILKIPSKFSFDFSFLAQTGSYLDRSGKGEFGEGYGLISHTNETVWKLGR